MVLCSNFYMASTQVQHLVTNSRAHSMAMGNIIKYLRFVISQVGPEESEAVAKAQLVEKLTSFLEERILLAQDSICQQSVDIIRTGDVVLTFGSSPLLRALLLRAQRTKAFRVIVVDAMPRWDGLHTVRSLLGEGEGQEGEASGACGDENEVVYTSLAGAAAAMKEATRVFLGECRL